MLALLPLTLGVLAALPQDPRPAAAQRPTVSWQRTLDDALHVQKATGLPLLVVVNMDGEVFNDRFAGDVYHDPAFIAKTRDYVCVVASPDRHTDSDYDALGNRIECPRFGGCTCSEHINIEPELFKRYFDGNRNAPRHVGVSSKGKILFDRFLDQSMQTAIAAIEKNRGKANPQHLTGTDDVADMFRRRDAMARTLLELRYRKASKSQRTKLLERAATADNQPLDLLRMALRDPDNSLCGLAAIALSKIAGSNALIDIEDALARVDDTDIRKALVEQLRTLGRSNAQAARMASHFERARVDLPQPWRNDWADATFDNSRESIERELDRVEAALRTTPDNPKLRLQLATAQAAFAQQLITAGGSGIALWFADAKRNAQKVKDESLLPEARALIAITSWYSNNGSAAKKAAIEAMAVGSSARTPDPWLASNFLDVLLQITAQTAYDRAEADPEASLGGEIGRVQSILSLLDKRERGEERGLLAGVGLLEYGGLRGEARRRLDTLARRYPGSIAVHNRWRARMMVDLGAELMRHAYAKYVTDADDRATAQWYAGYAALVAAERHTQDERRIEAENAYADSIERFLDSAQQNEGYADTSHHYAVLALAGRAEIRLQRNNHKGAVADLLQAAELRPASLDESDGLQRKPRAIAMRVQLALQAAEKTELAEQLNSIVK